MLRLSRWLDKIPARCFIIILIALFAAVYIYGNCKNDNIRAKYEKGKESKERALGEKDRATIEYISATSSWYTTWAGGLLASLVLAVGAALLREVRALRPVLLLLFPAYGFFVVSILAGNSLRGRITHSILNSKIVSYTSFNDHLMLQQHCLKWGVVCVGVAAVLFTWFLLLEKKTKASSK